MSITSILADKDLTDSEKLEQVQELVVVLRKKYGNADADVPSTRVSTAQGSMPFEHLDDDSKVHLLKGEAARIKAAAIAASEATPGLAVSSKSVELIATSPMFTNIPSVASFDVL